MRTLLIVAATSLLMSQYAAAQPPAGRGGGGRGGGRGAQQPAPPPAPPNPGLECLDQLQTPEYPKAALLAHVDGSVWTNTQVTTQGTAGKIDNQVVSAYGNGAALLVPPVEKALQASKFKSDCAGKTVSVVFRYQLHGEPVANPQVTSRKEAPTIVWIESQPEKAAAAPRPAAAATKK